MIKIFCMASLKIGLTKKQSMPDSVAFYLNYFSEYAVTKQMNGSTGSLFFVSRLSVFCAAILASVLYKSLIKTVALGPSRPGILKSMKISL